MPDLEWTFERIARCKTQIWAIAKQSIRSGNDVVFDLGLQKTSDRDRVKALCQEFDIEYQFYCLTADKSVRQNGVGKRNEGHGDTFEFPVSPEMFEITDRMFEMPNEFEPAKTDFVDTTNNA